MPAPREINWESPRKLIKSVFLNKIVKSRYGKNRHPIGHMVVELQDSTRYDMVGMAPADRLLPVHKVTKEAYGLGVLFALMEGQLEHQDINLPQVQERIRNSDIAFVNYKVSQEVFDRLWLYLHDYQSKGFDKYYNGTNRPREGTGGGCSAFAVSFLDVGGLQGLLPSDAWKVTVAVPDKLIGGDYCGNKRVSWFKVLFAKRWANTSSMDESYETLCLYEPTLFYKWILEKHYGSQETLNVYKGTRGNAKGLVVYARTQFSPNEPIWYAENTKALGSVRSGGIGD